MSIHTDIKIMKGRYIYNKSINVGGDIFCPYCGKVITKTSYQKMFCSNAKTHGKNNCKDNYWNMVDPKKRNRKHPKSHYDKYNVGAKSYNVRLGGNDNVHYNDIYNDFHPFEGLNDDEYKNF